MQAQFSLSIAVGIAPPALPVYVQPPCPAPDYLWTPGFWAYGDEGYYWVPGTWVAAPEPGLLWTPGYWGYGESGYFFHSGYWGPHVGFYGGINYGFGYTGVGFGGGEWRGRSFAYNTAVMNVNRTNITNVYVDRTVIHNTTINNNNIHTSFNGGANGIQARPTQEQQAFSREGHVQPTSMQTQHLQVASQDRANFASFNHGAPAHAAVQRPVSSPAELNRSAIPARGAAPAAFSGGGNQRGFGSNGGPQAANQSRGFAGAPVNGAVQPGARPGGMGQPAPMNRPNPTPQPAQQTYRPQPQQQEYRPQPAQPQNRPQPQQPQNRPEPTGRPAQAQPAARPAARPAPAEHERHQ